MTRPNGCHVPEQNYLLELPLNVGTGCLTIIEPVPKIIKAMLHEVFRGPEIEPGVDYLKCYFLFQKAQLLWKVVLSIAISYTPDRKLTLVDDALKPCETLALASNSQRYTKIAFQAQM